MKNLKTAKTAKAVPAKKAEPKSKPVAAKPAAKKEGPSKAKSSAKVEEVKPKVDPDKLSAEHRKIVDERIVPVEKLAAWKKEVAGIIDDLTAKMKDDPEMVERYQDLLPNFNSLHGAISNVEAVQEAISERMKRKFIIEQAELKQAQEKSKA